MQSVFRIGAAVAVCLGSAATAQVVGVVTNSTANVVLADGSTLFSGDNISGSVNDAAGLSGGSFDSTSDVNGPSITFKNGNISSGRLAGVTSFTSLDISFTNNSGGALTPRFSSTLLPAGLGLLVTSGCGAGPVRDCGEAPNSEIGFDDLDFTNIDSVDNRVAEASFSFRILNNGAAVYSLDGSISLRYDAQLDRNVLSTNLVDAASVLDGFVRTTFAGSDTGAAFAWDATDIEFDLPGTFEAGETRTLTYETLVTTYTRSPRTGECAGALAFAAFGDPIGRGGSIPPPSDLRVANNDVGTCGSGFTNPPPRFSTFRFATPVFENGTLAVELLPPFGGTVPEPASWALMIGGFGMVGAAARRRRTRHAA